jgi:iron uptake system component EfeO
VTRNELIPVLKAYERWVTGRLPVLAAQVRQLRTDIDSGDRAAAQRSWLAAHLTYETMGAAYGAFGDFDTRINGTPAPGRHAKDDRDLEGFHRIEALLWSSGPTEAAAMPATRLVSAVDGLQAAFDQARIDPTDIGLRAHEIVENAIQFELTGRTDAGSHTNLATVDANLSGSREALAPLRGLLRSRYPRLAATERAIDQAQDVVRSHRRADGSWTPLSELSRSDRELLDARVDAAVELLAPVAVLTDPRRPA